MAYIKECCQNYLSFDDLEVVLDGIIRRDSGCNITCILSDTEDYASYYIPKKHASIDEFRYAYNRFKENQSPSTCIETISTHEGSITFPTPEYKKMYSYIFNLFNENKFDLYSNETIIDI